MFDKYIICEDGFQNVPGGFQFKARLPYYRGLGLSMVEDLAVKVDGQAVDRSAVSVTVNEKTHTLDEMETEYEAVWEFGEPVPVTVAWPGGLAAGAHKLEITMTLRISYIPFPSVTSDSKMLQIAA